MTDRPQGSPGDEREHGRADKPLAASLRPLWWVASAAVVAAVVVLAVLRRHELLDALRLIRHARWPWLVLAGALEAASLLCLAALQRWLLVAGGVRMGLWLLMAIVLAANAVAGALPGGAGFAAAWTYQQFRRRGTTTALAGATLMASGVLSGSALFLLLAAGVASGDTSATGQGLRPLVIGLAVAVPALALATWLLFRFRHVRAGVWRAWRRIGVRQRWLYDAQQALFRMGRQLRGFRRGVVPWLRPAAFALGNWLLDLACLVVCLVALDVRVPWHGLLVLYALTQLAGALRLTPGGLGVVETGLSALLVLYGIPTAEAIAATLLYRVMSFWALQPFGWVCWVGLTWSTRHRVPPQDH